MPTKGGERLKTGGRRNHMKWNAGLPNASLPTSWKTSGPDTHESSLESSSHHPHNRSSFMFRCTSWADNEMNGHASQCINLWDRYSILNIDAEKTPGGSYVRDPHFHHSTTVGWETLLHKLTPNPVGIHWEGVSNSHPPLLESVKSSSLCNTSNNWLTKTNSCINVSMLITFIEPYILVFYRIVGMLYLNVLLSLTF